MLNRIQRRTLFVATSLVFAAGAQAQQVKLMTGPQGGSWYPLGGAIANIADKAGVKVQVLPGAGIANVKAVEGGKADLGFANSISTVDGVAGPRAVRDAGQERLQRRHAVPAVLPGRGQRRCEHQFAGRPQGQGDRRAAQGQHGRVHQPAVARGLRPEVPRHVARELCVLHRRGVADEGQQRAGVHARHHGAGVGHHGPGLGARHQAGRHPGRQVPGHAQAQPGLHQAGDPGRQLSEADRTCRPSATPRT